MLRYRNWTQNQLLAEQCSLLEKLLSAVLYRNAGAGPLPTPPALETDAEESQTSPICPCSAEVDTTPPTPESPPSDLEVPGIATIPCGSVPGNRHDWHTAWKCRACGVSVSQSAIMAQAWPLGWT